MNEQRRPSYLCTQNYDNEMKCNYPDWEIVYKCIKIVHCAPDISKIFKVFKRMKMLISMI